MERKTLQCGEFYESGPCMRRPLMKWSAIVESLRNTGLYSRGTFPGGPVNFIREHYVDRICHYMRQGLPEPPGLTRVRREQHP
jgi:hypothetical protein